MSLDLFLCDNPFDIPDYNLIVLGSSLEGLACAKAAAEFHANVCVISNSETFSDLQEDAFLEFFYQSVECYYQTNNHAFAYSWNVDSTETEYKWTDIMEPVGKAMKEWLDVRINKFFHRRVNYIEGNVKFINDRKIQFNDESNTIFWGDHFVIAPSGSSMRENKLPDVKGAAKYGNRILDLLKMEEFSGKILIVGSSRKAMQLAAILSYLLPVTLMSRNTPLKHFDQEMMNFVIRYHGITVLENCIVQYVSESFDKKLVIHYTQLSKVWRTSSVFDKIIFVPDDKPNIRGYQVENAKVRTFQKYIPIDKNFQTNIGHIYCMGRASCSPQSTAFMQEQNGRNLAQFIFCKKKCVNNIEDITSFINGRPSYCFIGLTEEKAIEGFGKDNVDVYHSYFRSNDDIYNLPSLRLYFMKVICLRDGDRKILGMHFLGPRAVTVMQGYAAAFKCGLTMKTLTLHCGIFPTCAREFTQLKITKRSGEELGVTVCCS